jgi:predicted nucleic acid-binding protein
LRIYADTSFLVSWIYKGDAGHSAARRAFAKHNTQDWLTTEWSQFETVNSLRQLCLGGLRPPTAEGLVRFFKRLHHAGPFQLAESVCEEAFRESRQLSAAYGNNIRMRSADVIHVALLEQINPDLFITRDNDQFALAKARGFQCLLV